MKKITSLFALFLFLSAGLFAQTAAPSVEEIASAYVETIGGAEAWLELKTMSMSGKANTQGMELPLKIVTAEGNKMRLDIDIMGSPMTQAYDGETGWMLFPMQGITEPKKMSAEEAADLADSPFLTEFINSAERGYTLEAVEGKELEGTPTYGVRVTKGEDYDRTYYFDTENMVPVMVETTMKGGQMKGVTSETYLSDYQEVDGLIVPMFMENKVNGQSILKMTFDTVELNPEVEEDFFSMKK